MTKLLINEAPLQVLPTLAVRLGLNEAIAVQQLHFAVTTFESQVVELDGHRWLKADLAWWGRQFPWWSSRSIERIWKTLRERGVVHTTRGREANVFRIDYDVLRQIDGSDPTDRPIQNRQIVGSPCKREGTAERTGENSIGADEPPVLFETEKDSAPLSPPSSAATTASVQDDSDVRTVWDYYVTVFGDEHMRIKDLTPARARTIRKAINGSSVEACQAAIDGLKSYRRKHPDGSQDISLGTIFETRPGGRNLTDQIEFWASQADTRNNAATHSKPGEGHKVPLDLSGVSAVVAGRVRARMLEVVRGFQGDSDDARERGRVAADWLRENCGWKATLNADGGIRWGYSDE